MEQCVASYRNYVGGDKCGHNNCINNVPFWNKSVYLIVTPHAVY
jgi:hypothetical protein